MANDLFHKKEEATQKTPDARLESLASRIKILEERYTNLSKREQLAEQNVLRFEKDMRTELKAVQARLLETKKTVTRIREQIELMEGESNIAAKRHELQVLESYLNLIEPLQFVTRKEMTTLLETLKSAKEEKGGSGA